MHMLLNLSSLLEDWFSSQVAHDRRRYRNKAALSVVR